MQVGLRVVRGPDWMCGDQDGGEGNVGTVVHLGGDGNVPDDTVLVYWDTGKQANYRAGSSGKYDLRVFDSAQTGLKHIHINCDGCKEVPLIGTRWKCADCENYDLCSTCFTSDVHDKQHAFLRFDQPQGDGIPVGKRTNFVKLQSKGFFPGARVTRGRDWKWGEQDGGNGRVGRLSEITAWSGVERSGAKVIWGMLRNNTYRAGHQGSVDLKCTTPANGPSYYRECLAKVREKRQRADANRLKVGDRVSICLEAEVLKTMSQGHGGWIDDMAECIGKIGTISKIDDDGDVHISYGLQTTWVFHPDAVTKIPTFQTGDKVRVLNDKQLVQNLQQKHGLNESMAVALGKQGMILAVNTDGNAVVKVGTDQWLFNPAALEATSQRGETESPGGMTTPQEILARGPLAVQIYNKALKEGKTNVRRLPIMLIGQARMGKTSLKKSLKGDLFDAEETSTIGVELDPSYFEMTTEIWRPDKLDETTRSDSAISFEHQAARLIVSEGMKDIEETSQATTGEPTQPTNNSQPSRIKDQKQEQPLNEPNMPDNSATLITKSIKFEDIKVDQPLIEHDMPDDVANLITKSTFEEIKVDEEEKIYLIVWDFGGQSVYYVTHPLFLTTRAIYVLVYNLSLCPNDPAIPVRKQGLCGKLEDSYSVKTNLDCLDSWLSSVASLVSDGDGDHEVPAGPETEKLPSKLPPVFLVCTHADQPYCSRASDTLAKEIFNSLLGNPYSSHLIDSVFAVDNSKSGSKDECPQVVRLREEIRTVAEELPQMKEEIPLKWLKFEKELRVKIKKGDKWIFLENAKQVAFEMCHISDEEEFTTLMKFLHDQRIVIHFDDTPSLNKMVVLDIQWLINVFKKVIAVEPYGGGGKQYKDQWRKLEKTGILEEKLLEHVWGSLYEDKETFESLIEIMEKFSLLCIWPSSDESKQYLVPSMLRSHPPEDIIQLVESSQIPSLCLTFNSSQVPIGLFPRLVLQFYQWCSKEWPSPCKPQLYHNFAKFFVCPDGGCSVVLLCHSSFIEIVSVHRANEVCDISPDARAVRRQVGLMLECMRKEFVWLKNMKCEMKVLCSVCCLGGSVHYCDDHDTKGCKREECLHFWSETVLQSGQPLICDRPPAVAGDPRLNIKQLASWFAFLDEQNQAIDECAARGLPSIAEEETKTLVLSNGVLESLQSTCDASNVVARLQDKLQLNQAALADPGPETTRMIRCIATIAKNENRPDVVQHLRQITPAGTTGPLLPGRLDVREIRQSQIRDLTISLCGGEDWKLVAEKLGLRPNEISFLDKRTKNPCMETLVHSRNQRFINVDTLYNVLVECGLPRLADLL